MRSVANACRYGIAATVLTSSSERVCRPTNWERRLRVAFGASSSRISARRSMGDTFLREMLNAQNFKRQIKSVSSKSSNGYCET
uniref:Uncharacterized protein n=1 Tax=Pristionchus pacificus TaxID=54126 RepID=A0A2A6BGK3_PRIPA|eukprot:PDM65055.1 hypothetical protein PRIPAC_53304 [Pristionchus pacificus]